MTAPIFTPEEEAEIEARARRRGYAGAREYVRALVEQDVQARGEAGSDKDQAYFWTPEWQAQEREADEDIQSGRVETFDNVEALLADLQNDGE